MNNLRTTAQRARMTNEGELDRLLPTTISVSPRSIELDEAAEIGAVLVWDWRAEGEEPKSWSQHEKALTDFARLAGADDAEILTYARRYGPLYLCKHDKPASHNPAGWIQSARSTGFTGSHAALAYLDSSRLVSKYVDLDERPEFACVPTRKEPLSVWRAYSRQVRGILSIAAKLHGISGGPRSGAADEWLDMAATKDAYGKLIATAQQEGRAPADDRVALAAEIRNLFGETGAGIHFSWPAFAAEPTIALDGLGALGTVAMKLAFAVARHPGFRSCRYCGDFFIPPHGNRTVCDHCRSEERHKKEARKRYRLSQKNAEVR